MLSFDFHTPHPVPIRPLTSVSSRSLPSNASSVARLSELISSRLHDCRLVVKHAHSCRDAHVRSSSIRHLPKPSALRRMESNETEGCEGWFRAEARSRDLGDKRNLSFCLGPAKRDTAHGWRVVTRRTDGHPLSSFWIDAIWCALMGRSRAAAPRARRSFSCQWTMNPSARGLSS